MNRSVAALAAAASVAIANPTPQPIPDPARGAGPVTTAFTYQGALTDAGAPADGPYDMRFTLADDLGATIAGPLCFDDVPVAAGIFSVTLDFGAHFTGDARRLVLAVRPGALGHCAAGDGYATLAPDQPLTASPYALGLRFPFISRQDLPGAMFTVMNTHAGGASAISGLMGADPATYPFDDRAALRGQTADPGAFGVLGISDRGVGVLAYTAGLTDSAIGIFARTDGPNTHALRAVAPNPTSWAAAFEGRVLMSGPVGIGVTPATTLDVNGTTRTTNLQITANAAPGRTLVSDADGNAVWASPVATTRADIGATPGPQTAFISPVATITVTEGERVFVSAHQALGSTTGASGLNIWIAYRATTGDPALHLVGPGIFGLKIGPNQRHVFSLSAILGNLPTGTYQVGMAGQHNGDFPWNDNEFGYVTAHVLR